MPPVLNLDDAPPSPKLAPIPHPSLIRGVRPTLTRQLSPHSEARRVGLRPRTTSHVSTQSVPEDKEVQFSLPEDNEVQFSLDEEKREEHSDEELRSAQGGYENRRRFRTYSEGSLITVDDDEILSPTGAFENKPTDDTRETSENAVRLFGHPLPRFPSRNEISSYIVKCAPCFWCNSESHLSMTSRSIALRLQFLDGFSGLIQAASASFLAVVLTSYKLVDRYTPYVDSGSDPRAYIPSTWSLTGNVLLAGLLGTIIFFLMMFSRRVIRDVNLVGSLRSMWCMLWIVPLEVYVTISMFDYHRVTEVWIKQYWSHSSMAWFRKWLCDPSSTYNSLCVVPVGGWPDFDNETEWCEAYFNSSACTRIRDAAQFQMAGYAYSFLLINGIFGIVFCILLTLTVKMVEEIISKPIVQKSRESSIPLWLALPTLGCLATGAVVLFSPTSPLKYDTESEYVWPGVVFLISGVLYCFVALLGWFISTVSILNAHDKRMKNVAIIVFIGTLTLTLLSVAAIFVYCIVFSVDYVDQGMTESLRATIACSISPETCSFCGNEEDKCPEWTNDDVSSVLRTSLKQLATLAAIFAVYSIGALRFGFVLRHHLSLYQIDYV